MYRKIIYIIASNKHLIELHGNPSSLIEKLIQNAVLRDLQQHHDSHIHINGHGSSWLHRECRHSGHRNHNNDRGHHSSGGEIEATPQATQTRRSRNGPHLQSCAPRHCPLESGQQPNQSPPARRQSQCRDQCEQEVQGPYFQHDNRKCLTKYESFRLTATAHTLNYAAVARKFKPLRPALASGANKTRRTAVSRRNPKNCACACQQNEGILDPEPALSMIQEPDPQRTAEHFIQRELPAAGRVLLELLKHSSSSLLETLLR